ncbi:hypothetical protein LCGC14_2413360 [marine sediment metagenome]|uniref:Uncharacterized protein n=1 Tax=marine sediment metagenome TaxID=412755 RepID=A0A0F9BRV3_9ZZZZ
MTKLEKEATEVVQVLRSLVPEYVTLDFLNKLDDDNLSGKRRYVLPDPTIATMRRIVRILEECDE